MYPNKHERVQDPPALVWTYRACSRKSWRCAFGKRAAMRVRTHTHKTDAVPEEQQAEENEGDDGQRVVRGHVLNINLPHSPRRAPRTPT